MSYDSGSETECPSSPVPQRRHSGKGLMAHLMPVPVPAPAAKRQRPAPVSVVSTEVHDVTIRELNMWKQKYLDLLSGMESSRTKTRPPSPLRPSSPPSPILLTDRDTERRAKARASIPAIQVPFVAQVCPTVSPTSSTTKRRRGLYEAEGRSTEETQALRDIHCGVSNLHKFFLANKDKLEEMKVPSAFGFACLNHKSLIREMCGLDQERGKQAFMVPVWRLNGAKKLAKEFDAAKDTITRIAKYLQSLSKQIEYFNEGKPSFYMSTVQGRPFVNSSSLLFNPKVERCIESMRVMFSTVSESTKTHPRFFDHGETWKMMMMCIETVKPDLRLGSAQENRSCVAQRDKGLVVHGVKGIESLKGHIRLMGAIPTRSSYRLLYKTKLPLEVSDNGKAEVAAVAEEEVKVNEVKVDEVKDVPANQLEVIPQDLSVEELTKIFNCDDKGKALPKDLFNQTTVANDDGDGLWDPNVQFITTGDLVDPLL